jgi:hypothetical protein
MKLNQIIQAQALPGIPGSIGLAADSFCLRLFSIMKPYSGPQQLVSPLG